MDVIEQLFGYCVTYKFVGQTAVQTIIIYDFGSSPMIILKPMYAAMSLLVKGGVFILYVLKYLLEADTTLSRKFRS